MTSGSGGEIARECMVFGVCAAQWFGLQKRASDRAGVSPAIVDVASERALNWAALSGEEREHLVDDILHE
jgi:hypothetical protein